MLPFTLVTTAGSLAPRQHACRPATRVEHAEHTLLRIAEHAVRLILSLYPAGSILKGLASGGGTAASRPGSHSVKGRAVNCWRLPLTEAGAAK